MKHIVRMFAGIICCAVLIQTNSFGQNITTFINDGAWCWFQDERVLVDVPNEKLIIGSTNQQASVDVVIYDIPGRRVENTWTSPRLQYADDHNAPGFVIAPNGNYLALWAHHYDSYNTRYSIYNGQSWSSERRFDWNTIPGGTNYTIAYSNVYYLSAEDRIYNFARANNRTPNFLYSDDNGNSWHFGGQLTTNNSNSYNKGYYKYWGNGVDRIDFVLTEEHPRDFTTSIYHGYLQGGRTYNTSGTVADNDIYNLNSIPTYQNFTQVFANGTQVNGVTMTRCWESDIMRYEDNSIAILFKCRANNSETDHRNFYARNNGTGSNWSITYIGRAGTKMYSSEEDYTGLGALSPDHPDRIYISSPYNPGNDNSQAGRREIWRGTTQDNGATWSWEAITSNSSQDNFRPVVPQWEPGKEAVLWFRGTYNTAQIFNTDIVGYIDENVAVDVKKGRVPSKLDFKAVNALPGSHQVALKYTVSAASQVALEVFSGSGEKVASLVNEMMPAGPHTAYWDTRSLASGVYLARVTVGGNSRLVKVMVAD